MRTSPQKHLPILPHLLHQLCVLTSSLGMLGPSMQVCLAFSFFAMLRQNNLAPPHLLRLTHLGTPTKEASFRHSSDVLILTRWSKTLQSVGRAPVLLILEVLEHLADPVAAFKFFSPPHLCSVHAAGRVTYDSYCAYPGKSPHHHDRYSGAELIHVLSPQSLSWRGYGSLPPTRA